MNGLGDCDARHFVSTLFAVRKLDETYDTPIKTSAVRVPVCNRFYQPRSELLVVFNFKQNEYALMMGLICLYDSTLWPCQGNHLFYYGLQSVLYSRR